MIGTVNAISALGMLPSVSVRSFLIKTRSFEKISRRYDPDCANHFPCKNSR